MLHSRGAAGCSSSSSKSAADAPLLCSCWGRPRVVHCRRLTLLLPLLLPPLQTAAANKGGLLSAMRQLADGHWVLAFSSADKAAAAVSLAQQHTERLQRLYRDALAVLCPLMPPAAAQQEQVLEQPPQCREQQLQQQPPDHRQQDLEHVSEPQECLQEQQQVVGADACPAGASHEAAAEQPTDLAAAADKAAATGQALGAAVALAAEAGG